MKGITNNLDNSPLSRELDPLLSREVTPLGPKSESNPDAKFTAASFDKLSAGILIAGSGPSGVVNAIRTKPEILDQATRQEVVSEQRERALPIEARTTTPAAESPASPLSKATSTSGLQAKIEQYTIDLPAQRLSIEA